MPRSSTFICVSLALMLAVAGCAASRDWKAAQRDDTLAAYERFLGEHPESRYSDRARARLAVLALERDWEQARRADTPGAYRAFLSGHPQSGFADRALALLAYSLARQDWEQAEKTDSIQGYREFIGKHAASEFASRAQEKLSLLYAERDWWEAQRADTIQGYEAFLRNHPASAFVLPAESRLIHLRARQDWERISGSIVPSDFDAFLKRHPDSAFAPAAAARGEALRRDWARWKRAEKAGTIASFEAFIREHPQSPYAQEAAAEIAALRKDAAGWNLVDALKKGRVMAEIKGSGIRSVSVTVRRLKRSAIKIIVPVGTYFMCRGSAQNMVSRRERVSVLAADEAVTVEIPAACANRSKEVPGEGETFDILTSPVDGELERLMPVLSAAGVSYAVEQAAVWIVTDNADYADLGSLVSQPAFQLTGGARVIGYEEAAGAMRMCDRAGIDITRRAIWHDRAEIFEGVRDPGLKQWIRDKAKLN